VPFQIAGDAQRNQRVEIALWAFRQKNSEFSFIASVPFFRRLRNERWFADTYVDLLETASKARKWVKPRIKLEVQKSHESMFKGTQPTLPNRLSLFFLF
jgi:hypothetical protein